MRIGGWDEKGGRTFANSPGGLGSIFLRLRTTSAQRIPERERMMMEGVPSFLMCFGSGGSSGEGMSEVVYIEPRQVLTLLDKGGKGCEVTRVFPLRC